MGLVLEWVYGTIVSTAEKARDGAKRSLGEPQTTSGNSATAYVAPCWTEKTREIAACAVRAVCIVAPRHAGSCIPRDKNSLRGSQPLMLRALWPLGPQAPASPRSSPPTSSW
jgi:hypothetical protein